MKRTFSLPLLAHSCAKIGDNRKNRRREERKSPLPLNPLPSLSPSLLFYFRIFCAKIEVNRKRRGGGGRIFPSSLFLSLSPLLFYFILQSFRANEPVCSLGSSTFFGITGVTEHNLISLELLFRIAEWTYSCKQTKGIKMPHLRNAINDAIIFY